MGVYRGRNVPGRGYRAQALLLQIVMGASLVRYRAQGLLLQVAKATKRKFDQSKFS